MRFIVIIVMMLFGAYIGGNCAMSSVVTEIGEKAIAEQTKNELIEIVFFVGPMRIFTGVIIGAGMFGLLSALLIFATNNSGTSKSKSTKNGNSLTSTEKRKLHRQNFLISRDGAYRECADCGNFRETD